MDVPLRTRHREILGAIVRAYIESGNRWVRGHFKAPQSDVDPASVRNVMADLADEGFLSQPHTSAGRVQREAFQFYVSSLQAGRMPLANRRLRGEFSGCTPWVRAWNGPVTFWWS